MLRLLTLLLVLVLGIPAVAEYPQTMSGDLREVRSPASPEWLAAVGSLRGDDASRTMWTDTTHYTAVLDRILAGH